MKYFWYYLRSSYRDARFTDGFYEASVGLEPSSKNLDYARGYGRGVTRIQDDAVVLAAAHAEIKARTASQRKLEEHVRSAHNRMETVKRSVAENL